jgi:hypothetical protein
MTAIARFVNVRAPQAVEDAGGARIRRITPRKGFESGFLRAVEEDRASYAHQMRELAQRVLREVDTHLSGIGIDDVVRAAVLPRGQNAKAAGEIVQARLGKAPAELVNAADFEKRVDATWNRFYALSILGQDRRREANELRAATVIADLAAAKPADKAPTWTTALTWRVVVPKGLFLPTKPREPAPDPEVGKMLGDLKGLRADIELLESIEHKARTFDRTYYREGAGAKATSREIAPDDGPRIDREADRDIAILSDRLRRTPELEGMADDLRRKLGDLDGGRARGDEMIEPENWLRNELSERSSVFSAKERKLLSRYEDVALAESEMDAVARVRDDLYRKAKALLVDPGVALPLAVVRSSDAQVVTSKLKLPHKGLGGKLVPLPVAPDLPRVHVLGIGDLIVVEERTNRYELGEVAHIENVMATETRNREHVRIAETETTSTVETEETAVDEKSLQTTSRFELTKETQEQLETSFEVTAGASVSAGYGPVKISANTGLTSSTSASSGTDTASTLAREAVEKAVSKVTTSLREEQIIRVLNRIEETNEHGFENDSDEHISGIYRWVDKYLTVRAVNYGRRLMLEMIVPEPANGLIYAETMHADEEPIPEPPVFDVEPDEITRSNYLDHAATFGATDVPSPPKHRIYQTLSYGAVNPGSNTEFSESGKTLTVPEGYQTTNVWKSSWLIYYGDTYHSKHYAGSKSVPGSDSALEGVTGSLQLASLVYAAAFVVGWKVRCELTDEAYDAWRMDAWAALKQASDAARAAYEEALAAQAIGQGVHVHGRNPDQNQQIVRDELKRASIKYLSEDMGHLIVAGHVRLNEQFDAADDTGDFDLEEARIEGMIIQFFEQAFEWHNMTWLLYPYFWAHAGRHHAKLLAEDPDPAMREFYGAGAARVVVPVPIDYEDAVLNFFETNEIWQGGEPPLVDDPEYVSIAEELKQGRTNSFTTPIYYESAGTPPPFIVDEWEEKLPTSLVMLQADDTLPSFPVGLTETDATALLDEAVQATGAGANWRNSIVDLLTLYGVDDAEDEAARRAFATDEGYPGDPDTDAIASVDGWCYFYVMGQIALNGLP